MIWTTSNNTTLGLLLVTAFGSMGGLGLVLDRCSIQNMKNILALSGQSPSDFIALVGFGPTLVDMKADVGIKGGSIVGIGKSGNPSIQPNVDIIIGPATDVINFRVLMIARIH